MSQKILIVEDEVALSEVLKDKMIHEGYEVETAKNGLEGLQAVKNNPPDLILMDVLMPVMDGMTALNELKKDEKTSKIPVIILSNMSDSQDVTKAMQYNTFDYLIKSDISLEAVLDKVRSKLGPNK
jgi:CheY-like chemotaxis protein